MSWKEVNIRSVIHPPISGEWGEEGDGVNVLRTTNFSNDGSLDLSEVVKRNIPLNKVEKKKLRFGDTILEKSGGSPTQPVGRVVYYHLMNGEPYLCNNFTTVIRPNEEVDSKYLFWFLFYNHASQKTLRYQNKTTGIINLQTERYLDHLQVPLPSLSIQKRIAATLDQGYALRKKDQQLLIKYDELLQSIFYDMFGDPIKNGKKWNSINLRTLFQSNPRLGTIIPISNEGTIPVVRVGELGGLDIDVEKCKKVKLPHQEKERYLLKENDILLARAIGSIHHLGKASLVRNVNQEMVFDSHVMRLQLVQSQINSLFFFYWLQSNGGRKIFLGHAGKTSIQFNVNAEQISRIKISLPPIILQNQFAAIAENIQNQKRQVKQQMQQGESLFQSLLQRAFKGELIK